MDGLEDARRVVMDKRTELDSLQKRKSQEKKELRSTKELIAVTEEATAVLQSVAQAVQHKIHSKIAGVVSKCIASVFDDPYEFKIHFEKKRGKTEARPVFVRDGHELSPMDGIGGGVIDIAAFALRVVCLVLKRPQGRKVLIADEPFKNVNGEGNRKRCAEMILALSEEFGLQIILTTGYDWLKIGNVINLSETP